MQARDLRQVLETFKQSKQARLLENICKREFYSFEMFSGKAKHFISIHSLSSFSSLFSILKTIFQVQVCKTLEHNRICPDISISAVY